MSKRLWNAFYRMLPVSLLETAQPCIENASMDIVIEERMREGSAKEMCKMRHIKVCHSQNECCYYDVPIDPATGIGKITISDIQAVQHVIVQTDESGQQMINGDEVDITYMVDEEVMQEDYASVIFTSTTSHRSVRIINQQLSETQLHVVKKLVDMNGDPLEFQEDMAFTLHVMQHGTEHCVTLDASNDFQETICDLQPGYTMVEESGCTGYVTRWRFNDEGETSDGRFDLLPQENELVMINELRADTSMKIEKYIRMENGHLCKPGCGEVYQVRIISDSDDRLIELSEDNDYCAVLCGLLPGYYDISELRDPMEAEPVYIVNGQEERCYANVELNDCEQASVMIINGNENPCFCEDLQSPLRICKFIRGCDGTISKPSKDLQFTVMLSGCGRKEAFNLNAGNNFCVDIANLCNGEYVIEEVSCNTDYTTSYIINGGRESTSACVRINGDSAFCVSVINEERNAGTVSICKYVRNEFGDLIKPQKHQCFTVTLSSYFCKRTFELNAGNDWCVCFDDLRFGSYEVREDTPCAYEVSYQVNCSKESKAARFVVDDCCENEIRIINSVAKSSCGILKICKFEETRSGELVKPGRDEEFEVCVESTCFRETYVLKAGNNWCVMLEGLIEGEYSITELDSFDYDVSYLVNQQEQCDAIVCMDGSNQEVSIINRRKNNGMLKLRGVVRCCNGELQRPSRGMLLDILVEGRECSEHVCLRAENNWCVILDYLPQGRYRIVQKDNLGFRVSYMIDGNEESFGNVELGQCDVEVLIVNQESDCTGTVRVTKYLEDERGNLFMPCPQDEFRFLLQGQGFSRTYRLCARNDFCVYFDDLLEGSYEISEVDENWNVRYRVNGECVDKACFTLGCEDAYIDIINSEQQCGSVTIEKRIRDGNRLVMPDEDAIYRVLLKGKNCHEVYELHAGNDFCICLNNLANQHYELRELGSGRHVYDINGELHDACYFLYEGESMHITVINEEMRYGCMLLEKRIANRDGNLHMPSHEESFCAIVEGETCTQKVELNSENDFCVRLYDLPQGHYEVRESPCEGYAVSWLINELPCASAVVDVCDEDIHITMINTPSPKGCICVNAVVEEDGMCRELCADEEVRVEIVSEHSKETLCLNSCNAFTVCLKHLLPGSYTLRVLNQGAVRFEIEECVFEDVVCIELNGECVNVCAVIKRMHRGNITVTKCMENAFGERSRPDQHDTFRIELLHDKETQECILSRENDWTAVFTQQACGAYEIREPGNHEVRYQINEQCPSDCGYFEVGKEDVSIVVLNASETMAKLHLEAVVKNCEDDLVQPHKDMVFHMRVKGKHIDKTFVLNERNQWHQMEELPQGEYQVMQREEAAFKELYYLVDDARECTADIVLKNDVHVQSVNVMKCAMGSITLSKYVRDASCGCLKKPQQEDEYEVDVRGEAFHQIITLNSCNRWKETLRNLPLGMYELRELNAEGTVCYIINGGKESQSALINVCEEHVDVKVINEEAQTRNGSIELCKLIRDTEGCYCYPQEQDSFWIRIKGEEETSRVLLNYANHFYASVRNLKDGWYEVMEEREQKGVQYVVNNAAPLARGIVHVMQNANTVNIINPQGAGNTGSITLSKYIEDAQGLLNRPVQGSYRIHVSSPGYNEIYTLSDRNGFTETIGPLPNGTYVVDELDHDDVSYIIDGGTQVDRAIVVVEHSGHQVQIINQEQIQDSGSITMAKYIRQDGMLMRPHRDASYVFHISGPSYNQLVTLDASNSWMCMLSDLKAGDYVISETTTTDAVSFIINGGNEVDRGIVHVAGSGSTVQIIDTPQRSASGSIQLDKYMRRNQDLVRPDEDFVSRVHISRPGYNEVFVLNRENNWSLRVDDLADGVYVVDEVDDQHDVSYIVNGASEVNSAIVNVEANSNTVQIINTVREAFGSIRIEKFMRGEGGKLTRPTADFVTRVHVSKPGYNEVFTLNAANDWSIVLKDLMDGWYVIDEVDSDDQVTYIINGGSEVANGIVHVEKNANEVRMIDATAGSGGAITLSKFIRNASGQLVLPSDTQRFVVALSGADMQTNVVLQKNNNWKSTLRNLAAGTYQVKELEVSGFDVTYIVNDAQESSSATVQVQGDAHNVSIINALKSSYGKLEITKFIKQANGTLIRPADGDHYTVEIYNMTTMRRVDLNFGNSFTYVVNDLPKGTYSIREINNTQFITTYRVNGGAETDSATVTMGDAASNVVEVINELIVNRSTIEVFKYMLDDDGKYLPPSAPDTYQFRITGEGIDQVYDLTVDNSWHQSLNTYPSGTYQVQEIGSSYPIQYLVNSPELVDEAKFTVLPGTTMVIGIINRTGGVQNGTMKLTKQLRNAQGELQRPADTQSYVMQVTSDTFNRFVTLDKDNDFIEQLENLPYGTYQIRETSGRGSVSFIINQEAETEQGILKIESGMANTVDIINTESQPFYRSDAANTVKIVIE